MWKLYCGLYAIFKNYFGGERNSSAEMFGAVKPSDTVETDFWVRVTSPGLPKVNRPSRDGGVARETKLCFCELQLMNQTGKVRGNPAGASADPSIFKARFAALRQSKGMTQDDMAGRLKVNLKTIQNWESGVALPRRRKVEEIAKELGCPVTYFYPVPRPVEAIKALAHIFEAEKDCVEVWILKTGRPFVSAENAALRKRMLDLMEAGIDFFFVCPSEPWADLQPTAYTSYRQFHAQVNQLPKAAKYLQHSNWVRVPDKTVADSLGLVDDWMSFVCAVYSEEGIRKRGKLYDVWVEFALDIESSPEGVKKEWFWVELSRAEAASWWFRRCATLQKLPKQSDPENNSRIRKES